MSERAAAQLEADIDRVLEWLDAAGLADDHPSRWALKRLTASAYSRPLPTERCSCWLGTGATFGDSRQREQCAIHGGASPVHEAEPTSVNRDEEIRNEIHEWLLRQFPDFDDDTSGEDSADVVDHLKVLFRRSLGRQPVPAALSQLMQYEPGYDFGHRAKDGTPAIVMVPGGDEGGWLKVEDVVASCASASPSPAVEPMKGLVSRIDAYLQGGGLFNPERGEHDAVRDLLMDTRLALSAALEGAATKERRPNCENGDCADHYGDPLAWCARCAE